MADYYDILGVSSSASSTDIRMAYKRMAMQYHPDRNAGDKEAEEQFKRINEAYHVLSDPLKKSRYDARNNPVVEEARVYDYHEFNRQRFWRGQQAQQKYYRIDKEYFKIQGLAFLVFIVIAGFCFALIHTGYYFIDQKREARWQENSRSIQQVNALFGSGRLEEAFSLVNLLREKDPLEFRFFTAQDSLIGALETMAEKDFSSQQFSTAIGYYRLLEKHQKPARFETQERIAMSQYHLGNFEESLLLLKQLHAAQPANIRIVTQIGYINLDKLENPEEALLYFNHGKKLFKENLSSIYGDAFMLVMDPKDVSDIYYDIFEGRARTNLLLKHFDAVRNDCNWATYLRPEKAMAYRLRAEANILGKTYENICRDLRDADRLGDVLAEPLLRKHCR